MSTFIWILRFRVRGLLRTLGQGAFGFLVIAPLVLGALAAVVDRFLPWLRGPLESLVAVGEAGPTATGLGSGPAPIALVIAILLTGVGLAGAAAELFPRRGHALVLDLMPVSALVRFLSAWLARFLGQMPLLAALLILAWAIARRLPPPAAPQLVTWSLSLLAAGAVLTGVELAAVLLLVRFGGWRPPVVIGAGVSLITAALVAPEPLVWVILAPWTVPAAAITRVLAEASAVELPPSAFDDAWLVVAAIIVSVAVAGALSRRWQRRLRQSALAQSRGGPRRAGRFFDRALGRLASAPRALLVRDLLLVVRRFSAAVDVAALLSVGALVAGAGVTRLPLPAFWSARLPLIFAAASVLAAVSIVPFVLRHQLPRAWVERAAGAEPSAIWRAKLWLALLLALGPTALGSGMILVFGRGDLAARGLDIATLIAVAVMISSLIGLASFEIAERPVVGLVFGALVAGAFAALVILYREFTLAWLVGYGLLAATVADRATHRVRFTEVAR